MVHASLLLLLASCSCFASATNFPVTVIETVSVPELDVHVVHPGNSVKKLRCHDNKTGSSIDDIVWQFKRCGFGLNLTACRDLPRDTPWHLALCRNQTKLCTSSTLAITNPSAADSGLYRCLQKNYMMPKYRINRTIQLDVRDPKSKSIEIVPEVSNLDNQTVFENQTAVLRCRVRSMVYPFIAWVRYNMVNSDTNFVINGIPHQFLNGSVIHEGPNYLYTSKLYIPQTKLDDAGLYFCYALGSTDTVTKEAFLNVVPLVSHFDDFAGSGYWMWWFAVAMCFTLAICFFIIFVLAFKKRPKVISVSSDEGKEMLEC